MRLHDSACQTWGSYHLYNSAPSAVNLECRYKGSSQHFGPHVDESVKLGGGAATAYTLLIYLSGSLTGGETVFYGGHLLPDSAPTNPGAWPDRSFALHET